MKCSDFLQKNTVALIITGSVLVLVISSISGAASGLVIAQRMVPDLVAANQNVFKIPSTSGTLAINDITATSVSTSIRLVPLQMEDFTLRAIPESIFNRRSPVGVLYAHKKSPGNQSFLTQEEQIGRAVALTSDGWFVTSATVVEGVRLVDLLIWHAGKAYQVENGVVDKSTQAVFLKTNARDLSVTAFADYWSGRTGLAAWLEPSAEQFAPSSIMAVRNAALSDVFFSDHPVRRILALGDLQKIERGSPLWDAKGALIGIVENSNEGRVTIIPGNALSSSLQSLIANGSVEHASLGVYSVDLSLVRVLNADENMPERGAWLREDKKTSKALVKDSAAEKAGLKTGDVILQVDRDILDGSLDLSDIVMQYRPGSTVNLRVWRLNEELEIPVTFGSQITSEPLL